MSYSPPATGSDAGAARSERFDENNIVWVDMEMSGLNPDSDRVIEVAVVVTDAQLDVIAEGPVIAVHQEDRVLGAMDDWNTSTHGRSGLTQRVRDSLIDEIEAERVLIEFLARFVPPRKSPMAGNSICQDRRFMARWMPQLEAFFHYRNLDVSTLKELARRWKPAVAQGIKKHGKHEALADIYESIEEMKHYRDNFIK